MAKDKMYGKTLRKNFARHEEIMEMPNLLELQKKSYRWFLDEGLQEVFTDVASITNYAGNLELSFIGYKMDEAPKYDVEECKARDATYAAPLKVNVRLYNNQTQEIKEQEIFMGDFPLMTQSGTFVINGAERVVVSQIVRSPGVYYGKEIDLKTDLPLLTSTAIPYRGAWLEYETDTNEVFWVRIDKNRKIPITELIRAIGGQVYMLGGGYLQELLLHVAGQDALEGKPLAPGENGGGDLVQLRGSQNEHQMLRRLLQNFQQGVEGRRGQHVDLVHDVDPLFHIGGGVDGLVPEGPDLVHAVVGGGVQLQHIQKAAVLDAEAGRALAAGVSVHRVLTVDRLGQNFGAGGLAGAPGAGEEVGVGSPALGYLLLQGLRDMGLADDIGKCLGPPFAVQGLVHGAPPG